MSAIAPENLVSKLSFGLFGDAEPDSIIRLRRLLTREAKSYVAQGKPSVSRTAIFDVTTGALPKRDEMFQFLQLFLEELIKKKDQYHPLPNDQKQVLGQIHTFCRRNRKSETDLVVRGNAAGHVTIHQDRIYPRRQYLDEMDYFVGTYRVFKRRFSLSKTQPYSREIVQIEKFGTHLYVKWWFLLDEKKVTVYEGTLLLLGSAVWAITYNASLGGRFRIFNATRAVWGRVKPERYTGILLTTTPDPREPLPTTSRVYLEKIDALTEEKIRAEVTHLSEAQLKHPNKRLILRIISNSVSPSGRLDALNNLLKPRQ